MIEEAPKDKVKAAAGSTFSAIIDVGCGAVLVGAVAMALVKGITVIKEGMSKS